MQKNRLYVLFVGLLMVYLEECPLKIFKRIGRLCWDIILAFCSVLEDLLSFVFEIFYILYSLNINKIKRKMNYIFLYSIHSARKRMELNLHELQFQSGQCDNNEIDVFLHTKWWTVTSYFLCFYLFFFMSTSTLKLCLQPGGTTTPDKNGKAHPTEHKLPILVWYWFWKHHARKPPNKDMNAACVSCI